MTPERIAELRALAAQAAPGPWKIHPSKGGDPTVVCIVKRFDLSIGSVEAGSDWGVFHRKDAAFIAAARTALPEALEIIEAMQRVIDEFDTGERLDPDGGEHRLRREMARALFGSRKEPTDSSDGFYVPVADLTTTTYAKEAASEALDAIERVRALCTEWYRDDVAGWERRGAFQECARELLAALEGKSDG